MSLVETIQESEYTILIRTQEPAHMEFDIYEVVGWTQGGCQLYTRRCANEKLDTVETLAEAQRFCHCSIKFDGCSNWEFDEPGLHICGLEHLQQYHNMMKTTFKLAKERMPGWCGG